MLNRLFPQLKSGHFNSDYGIQDAEFWTLVRPHKPTVAMSMRMAPGVVTAGASAVRGHSPVLCAVFGVCACWR